MDDNNNMISEDKCEFLKADGTCTGTPYGRCLHMDTDRKCRADEGWEYEEEEDGNE